MLPWLRPGLSPGWPSNRLPRRPARALRIVVVAGNPQEIGSLRSTTDHFPQCTGGQGHHSAHQRSTPIEWGRRTSSLFGLQKFRFEIDRPRHSCANRTAAVSDMRSAPSNAPVLRLQTYGVLAPPNLPWQGSRRRGTGTCTSCHIDSRSSASCLAISSKIPLRSLGLLGRNQKSSPLEQDLSTSSVVLLGTESPML